MLPPNVPASSNRPNEKDVRPKKLSIVTRIMSIANKDIDDKKVQTPQHLKNTSQSHLRLILFEISLCINHPVMLYTILLGTTTDLSNSNHNAPYLLLAILLYKLCANIPSPFASETESDVCVTLVTFTRDTCSPF